MQSSWASAGRASHGVAQGVALQAQRREEPMQRNAWLHCGESVLYADNTESTSQQCSDAMQQHCNHPTAAANIPNSLACTTPRLSAPLVGSPRQLTVRLRIPELAAVRLAIGRVEQLHYLGYAVLILHRRLRQAEMAGTSVAALSLHPACSHAQRIQSTSHTGHTARGQQTARTQCGQLPVSQSQSIGSCCSSRCSVCCCVRAGRTWMEGHSRNLVVLEVYASCEVVDCGLAQPVDQLRRGLQHLQQLRTTGGAG